MFTCRDASHFVASDEIKSAGLWKRLSWWLHLIMCEHCRRYAAQIQALGVQARLKFSSDPPSQEEIDRLKASIFSCLPGTDPDDPED